MQFGFSTLAAIGLLFLTATPSSSAEAMAQAGCAPVNGLRFVCGPPKPEDILLVPGTRWLITGGKIVGGGLNLVDTEAESWKVLYTGGPKQSRPDLERYPHCAGPPDPSRFIAHGLALRPGPVLGVHRLYVVGHGDATKGDVEGIQVFALDARGAEPELTWTGCVPMPKGMMANAVAAFGDGTIVATVRGDGVAASGPRASKAGVTVGAVVSWKPGDAAFHQLPGTARFGVNGIETSLDDKEFYLISVESRSVAVFSRGDTSQPLRESQAPLTSMDNIHWTAGRLIATGKMHDEPACGGTRQQLFDQGRDLHDCVRGYAVVELNPLTMAWRVVAYAEPNPAIDGVASAAIVGKTLWLSSFLNERVGYRPLPEFK